MSGEMNHQSLRGNAHTHQNNMKCLDLQSLTIQHIETHKTLTTQDLKQDLHKLKNYQTDSNHNCFYGNQFLYHYQLKNLLRCERNGKTIYDIYNDSKQWNKLLADTQKRNRGGNTAASNVFECYRINQGSVVMFKAVTARYLYKKYNATSVLDPTAGWGGRMLGAWAADIDYTGIDTNIQMKSAYDQMIDFLDNDAVTWGNGLFRTDKHSQLQMIWQDCLTVDFSTLAYDFVLTSPPYINLEMYEHMPGWQSDSDFYKNFLIPLWHKCIDNIQPQGYVCFNISPEMYSNAVAYGLPATDQSEDLLQQTGLRHRQDKIYIWKKK